MFSFARSVVTAAAAGLLAFSGGAAATVPGETGVEAAFQNIQRAVMERDTRLLEQLVDPGFEMLHASGQSEPRGV